MSLRVALRADADARIGVGHAMRAFAIAQALVDERIDTELVTRACTPGVARRFESEGIRIRTIDSDTPERATEGLSANDWIVIDGYGLDAGYIAACERRGVRALVIDDDAARAPITAQALLNPNLHASAATYAAWHCRDKLLGTRWTPMRREFRTEVDTPDRTPRVLLTMGGSDPPGVTSMLLPPLCRRLAPLRIDVVVGAANARRDEILAIAASFPNVNVRTDVNNMSELMRGASVAVSASGSTAWELASTSVPMLLVSLAPNQRPVAEALARAGAAVDLGEHGILDPERVAVAVGDLLDDSHRSGALVVCAQRIVDGRGALRIARYLRSGEIDGTTSGGGGA